VRDARPHVAPTGDVCEPAREKGAVRALPPTPAVDD
jgi:hypothetical protein